MKVILIIYVDKLEFQGPLGLRLLGRPSDPTGTGPPNPGPHFPRSSNTQLAVGAASFQLLPVRAWRWEAGIHIEVASSWVTKLNYVA